MGSATVPSSSMTPASGKPNIHSASSQEIVSCLSFWGLGEIPSATLALKETPPVLQNHTHCCFLNIYSDATLNGAVTCTEGETQHHMETTSFWLILILGFGNNGISKDTCLPFSLPLLHTLQRRAWERIGGEEEGAQAVIKAMERVPIISLQISS